MKTRKRSNAPIFWGLFGAGGMLAALFGPMLVFITGVAIPLGLLLPSGKGFIFVIISLFLWHAAHRIFHSLHEIGIHGGFGAKLQTYGVALAGTVVSATVLLRIGF